jgi:secreted trypsin-like serine protease
MTTKQDLNNTIASSSLGQKQSTPRRKQSNTPTENTFKKKEIGKPAPMSSYR